MTPAQLAELGDDDLALIGELVRRRELEDPVAFAVRVLGFTPWDRQAEVMRAVARHPRVAVRSGHKIGKSAAAASIALWWVSTRPRGTVVMTSATDEQVRLILWAELKRMYDSALEPIGGSIHESHRTGLTFPDGRRIVGFGTNKSENMAGFSGSELLFVVDEASGVEDEIFDAVEGNRAGGARVVMFGNPTRQSGKFYDAFHHAAKFWHCVHVSAEETPNVREGRQVVPGLATREYIDEKLAEYGRGSPWYQVRVLGDFPDSAQDAVIGVALVRAGGDEWRMPDRSDGRLEIGVDVARFGDDETVIAARRGCYAYPMQTLQNADTVRVAREVRDVARQLRSPDERVVVRVDGTGVGGGVVDILRAAGDVEVVDVCAASSAGDDRYSRMRDRLWFGVREWLGRGGKFRRDQRLEDELAAPTYFFDPRGRFRVESKDDLRERLRPRRSPDRADALALAVCDFGVSSSAAYDAPPYLDFAPDQDAAALARRVEDICWGR